MNSNLSYSPETLRSGQNLWFFLSHVTLKFDGWPSKTIGHLFYATSSFMHHFVAISEFKLELQSGNAQFGSKSTILLAVWPWNLTDDPEKQQGTSSKQHEALCIIQSSYVNSNWSYGPETAKLFWPLTLIFCMDITFVIGDNSWKFHDDTMMGTWRKRCDGQTDGQTDKWTEPFIKLLGRSWKIVAILSRPRVSVYKYSVSRVLGRD